MEFLSPFINMFEHDEDYIRLVNNLEYYLALKLRFERMGYNSVLEINYPICKLGDVELHFNHYVSMEEVEQKWYERIQRINWDNLFIMMFTESRQSLERFDCLPYNKKVCFVPFESLVQSAFYLQVKSRKGMEDVPFWEIVCKTASGPLHDYDLIELLSQGTHKHGRYYVD